MKTRNPIGVAYLLSPKRKQATPRLLLFLLLLSNGRRRFSRRRGGAKRGKEREREREKKKEGERSSSSSFDTSAKRARTIYKNGDKMPRWKKKKSSNKFCRRGEDSFFSINFVKSFIHSFKAHPVKLFLINISFWNPPNPPLFFFDWTTTIFTFLQKTLKKESGQKVSSNRIFFDVGFRVFKSLLSSRIIFRRRRGRIIILLFINSSFFFHRAVKHYY